MRFTQTDRSGLGLALILLLALGTTDAQSETWWAQGGWVRSDVGLADQGDGLWVGVEGAHTLGTGHWELGYSLAYVQEVGAQTMLFSDPREGSQVGPAEVTLHTLQPGVNLGLVHDLGSFNMRLYGGGAVNLKLSEQWTHPAGEADRQYSFENLDLDLQLGLSLRRDNFSLDFRYSLGLLDQLLVEGAPPTGKSSQAEDPLGGEALPAAGEKVSSWRVGLGYRFR